LHAVRQTNLIATGNLLIGSKDSTPETPIDGRGSLHMEAGQNLEIAAGAHIKTKGDLIALAGSALVLRAQEGSSSSKIARLTSQKTILLHGEALRLHGSQAKAKDSLTLSSLGGDIKLEPIIAKGNLQPTRLQAGKELTVAAYEGNIDAHALHTDSKSLILLGAENVKIQSSPKVAAGPLKNRLLAKTNAHVGSLSKNLLVDNTEISTLVGNINLHAADSAAMSTTNLNAGKNLTLASSGSLLIEDSTLNADGFLNLSSAGNQKIRTSKLTSGAASLYVNKGVLELDQITLSTKPPTTASLGRVSGQINIESSGPIVVDGNAQSSMRSKFSAHTDLTILAGEGPITLTPEDAAQTGTGLRLSSSQIAARRSLSIATRKGPLTLLGIAGEHGNPSARSVELSAKGDISLGGATVDIQGATVRSGANLSVTSYSGSLLIDGIRNNFTSYRPAHRIQTLKENIASVTAQHAALLNNPEYAELNAQVDKFWKDLGPACWFWYHYGDDICRSPPLHKLEPILAKRDLFEAPMGALYKEKLELEKTLATLDSDAQGYEHLGAKLSARNIHLMSANGIAIHGADISASQTAEIKASGNLPGNTTTAAEQEASAGIRITGLSDFYEYGSPRSNKHAWAVISTPTRIIGNKNVIVQSAGSGAPADLVINDTEVASLSGSISLQSFSNIFLESGQEEFYSYSQRRYRRGNWFKRRRITETRINQEATASPVILNGGTIAIKSGGSVHAQATEFSAPKGGITLTAANALSLYAVPEVSYEKVDVRRRSSVLGVSTSRRKSTTTREAATQLPTTLVASSAQTSSGWNTLLQGTIFETSLKGADIKVGVGDQARSDARIVLEGIKQRVAERQTKEGNYVVWQRSLDAGSISESLAMPKFTGPTPPSFHGPISANIPNGHFKAELKALINQPGYAYLGTLAKRDDINWQPVTLAYKTWRESQKGLTPAGATLLAAAVSWATHGAGSELMNSVTGHSVNSMASKMASAAFTSLSAQAAVSLINNQGDISKTLKALANSDIARAALATAITAGAMAHVTELSGIQDIAGGSAVTNRLAFNLINAGGHALSYAAINGDDLKDALRAGVIGGLVNTAHGEITRSYIKNLQNAHIADQMLHKIAHAVAGCAAGAVAGNSCRDGAIGATAAEMVAELFMDDFPSLEAPTAQWEAFHNKVKTYGKLVAGSIAAYIGGNPQTAITAAEVAYDNNGRLTIRMRAEQLRLSPQQYYFNSYGANLMKSILAKGGRAPDRMIAPNATVRFTRRDVEELAEILRKLDPDSHLILRVPTQLRSPLPDTYMYIQWGLNSDILASARDVTAFGFKRDGNAYFLELLARYPQLFSPRNAIRIKDGMAPTIDLQWVRHNPSHISFIGETLVHHHWMQGPLIVPLPRPIHNSWSRYLHPYQ
jgi:filamentous hemagglutinin